MKPHLPTKLLWVGRTAVRCDRNYDDIRALREALSAVPDRELLALCVVSGVCAEQERETRRSLAYWLAQAAKSGEVAP